MRAPDKAKFTDEFRDFISEVIVPASRRNVKKERSFKIQFCIEFGRFVLERLEKAPDDDVARYWFNLGENVIAGIIEEELRKTRQRKISTPPTRTRLQNN